MVLQIVKRTAQNNKWRLHNHSTVMPMQLLDYKEAKRRIDRTKRLRQRNIYTRDKSTGAVRFHHVRDTSWVRVVTGVERRIEHSAGQRRRLINFKYFPTNFRIDKINKENLPMRTKTNEEIRMFKFYFRLLIDNSFGLDQSVTD